MDNTDWERVARTTKDYLEGQPRARMLIEIVGKDRGQPQWWESCKSWPGTRSATCDPAAARNI